MVTLLPPVEETEDYNRATELGNLVVSGDLGQSSAREMREGDRLQMYKL